MIKSSPPLVTVLMCVHNGGHYFREAFASLLSQSYRRIKILIVDDASTDGVVEEIALMNDTRISVLRNPSKLGLTRSLNLGLDAAEGKYIARMDADDICHPSRVERQVSFLENHGDVVACGVWARLIDGKGGDIGCMRPPSGKSMAYRFWRPPAIIHPAAMFRAEALKAARYDESIPYGQDYDLFLRLAQHGRLDNLPEYLLRYRQHENAITSGRRKEQLHWSYAIFNRHFRNKGISQAQYESLLFEFSASPLERWAALGALSREVPMPLGYRLADNAKYAWKWVKARSSIS